MKKYYHKKLIRDQIPEIIESNKGKYETRVLNDSEFESELKKKLLEEVNELLSAKKGEELNELADVLEITKALASHYKISFDKLQKYQLEKRRKRGGFKKKLFLIWSDQPAGK
jgi:predicted house-cleaning noncanonical NTP pyrophosphatase (MazG superfamily)